MEAENTQRFTNREIGRFQKREQDENTSPDIDIFVQVYCWAEQDGLENGLFKWAHYPSGKKIGVPDRDLFFLFGDDPQLILPAITKASTLQNPSMKRVALRCSRQNSSRKPFF